MTKVGGGWEEGSMIQRWKAMGDENGEAAGASSGAIVQVSLCMLVLIQRAMQCGGRA